MFAVCDAAQPDELLGLVGLHGVDLTGEPGGTAEIGYWMRTEGRGRGLMTRATRLASAWAFDELGLEVGRDENGWALGQLGGSGQGSSPVVAAARTRSRDRAWRTASSTAAYRAVARLLTTASMCSMACRNVEP